MRNDAELALEDFYTSLGEDAGGGVLNFESSWVKSKKRIGVTKQAKKRIGKTSEKGVTKPVKTMR